MVILKSVMEYQNRCRTLIRRCIEMVNEFSFEEGVEQQAIKRGIPGLIQAIPFNMAEVESGSMGIRTIYAHPHLRLTIYRVPQSTIMKLHDHPNMHVLSYIIEGSMLASIYNVNPVTGLYKKSQKILEEKAITALNPSYNNFHQFEATDNQCSFMDIIFPDYNEDDRKYTQYDAVMQDCGEFKLIPCQGDTVINFVDI